MMQQRLTNLIAAVSGAHIDAPPPNGATPNTAIDTAVLVNDIVYDNRQVKPGNLFVAIVGASADGHTFVRQAVQAGAVAVAIETGRTAEFADLPVPRLVVPNGRVALAPLATAFYQTPTRNLYLAGVTGTNGKTTTTLMVDSIARAAGDITGTIGTLGATVGDTALPGERTTPEAPDLQRLFHQMRAAGAQSAAMEVASHALALGRTEGCLFDVGIFTNLTQDHLDFHQTMTAYRDSKGLLFTTYADAARAAGKGFVAVMNVDDAAGRYYQGITTATRTLTYSAKKDSTPADIRAENITLAVDRITFTAKTPVGDIPVALGFGGTFNVYNALAAVAYGVARGLSPTVIAEGLATCAPVPGRFQPVHAFDSVMGNQPFAILVDYAHTPDGLENVLQSVKALPHARIITVFGCGGNRDNKKRPIMGGIAKRYSDIAIVTSDNPRREDPQAIVREVLTGMGDDAPGNADVRHEVDRRAAIAQAVQLAKAGDVVVIAGKGHETYQLIGDAVLPFDDVQVACEEVLRCYKP